jgi:hypothetical protein
MARFQENKKPEFSSGSIIDVLVFLVSRRIGAFDGFSHIVVVG